MSLIRSTDDVTKLVREMKLEWPPTDPDFRRIADALPLAVLEAAYVDKLDAHPRLDVGRRAETASQKLAVMRQIYAAWLRAPGKELGDVISEAIDAEAGAAASDAYLAQFLVFAGDSALASCIEKQYPPRK
jgi:hypothetical protein